MSTTVPWSTERVSRSLRVAGWLWCIGLWESLQWQRCVVLFSLDDTGLLWRKMLNCCALNGLIFLGSIAWWEYALQPSIRWAAAAGIAPVAGQQAGMHLEATLSLVYQLLWLAPAYLVTLLVSAAWYTEMAAMAVQVRPRYDAKVLSAQAQLHHQQRLPDLGNAGKEAALFNTAVHSPAVHSPPPMGAGSPSPAGAPLTIAAQEVYRVLLFLVFYAEIWLLGHVPLLGRLLYVLFSCWLFAFYCYDYQWALRGTPLPDRLAFFEYSAAFFCGFGFIMAATTMLPFYVGAAVLAVLYPLFVLIACDSNPVAIVHSAVATSLTQGSATDASGKGKTAQQLPTDGKLDMAAAGLVRIPVFACALGPTNFLLSLSKSSKV